MKLLDRYLQAVRGLLPKGQQDDIIQELSDAILSRMEDQEAELGRPLTEAEQETILNRYGSPMQVAGRYQTAQHSVAFGRQLIGPVLFPLYIKILLLNLAITIVVSGVAAVAFASHQPMLQTAMAMLSHFVFQFAIITGIFTLAQRSGDRFPWGWKSTAASRPTAKDERRIPRSQSIAELIVLVVFLPWLPTLPFYPRTIFGDGIALLRFGPGAQILLNAVFPLILLGVIRSCILLVRPRWVRFYWVMRLAATSASLVVLGLSLRTGEWIVLANPGGGDPAHKLAWLAEKLNRGAGFGLMAMLVGCAIVWAVELRRLVRLQFSGEEPGEGPSQDLAEPLHPQGRQA
ncbi:MAG TPA: hypothetical protein VLB76_27640 [Thermoanaerobaculia bacterium]|nr:hypothetical protein [Thermoanaerobaculia bacterium]